MPLSIRSAQTLRKCRLRDLEHCRVLQDSAYGYLKVWKYCYSSRMTLSAKQLSILTGRELTPLAVKVNGLLVLILAQYRPSH